MEKDAGKEAPLFCASQGETNVGGSMHERDEGGQ